MSDDRLSLANILGPWQQPDWGSGLIEQCRVAWTTPFHQLTNGQLAMLLRQQIAIAYLLPLVKQRIEDGIEDDSELYDGELKNALDAASKGA